MPEILAFVPDVFFQARISETARRTGARVRFAGTVDAFLAAANAGQDLPALIVVDLNANEAGNAEAGLAALERLRAAGNQTPAVAFLSHVQHDLAVRAAAFSAVEVMPRSKFTQDLPAILSRVKA
ncbi:MAG TPA: hypothetical protein VFO34_07890 [Candidatus Acidoferrales bacterium]|nr:hypothetical protein [Candidatus Acidoferrales bacterium]